MSSDSHRRDFLAGRAAWRALEQAAAKRADEIAGSPHSEAPDRSPTTYLVEVSRRAMACDFQVLLNAQQESRGVDVAVQSLELVEQLEQQLSVFLPHSEVSRINQQACAEPVAVERRLFGLLEQCLEIHRATGGAFDITAAPLWKLWGFRRRAGRLPSAEEIDAALSQVGSRWVQLDSEATTVRFDRDGIELNLGAIGKGYALDRCQELLTGSGVDDYLVHGGNSSILARGSRSGSAGTRAGWWIAVRHPLRAEQRIAEVILRDRALGTSGTAHQFFHHQGRRYGHILDPRSGWPADRVLGSTVLAPTAALADALSTAFFVLGREGAAEYCSQHEHVSALLAVPGDRAGQVDLVPIGLSDSDWRRL